MFDSALAVTHSPKYKIFSFQFYFLGVGILLLQLKFGENTNIKVTRMLVTYHTRQSTFMQYIFTRGSYIVKAPLLMTIRSWTSRSFSYTGIPGFTLCMKWYHYRLKCRYSKSYSYRKKVIYLNFKINWIFHHWNNSNKKLLLHKYNFF